MQRRLRPEPAHVSVVVVAFLLAICFCPGVATAYEFNGRVSADLYSYQGLDQDHYRPYFRFNGDLLAWQSATGRSLRLHSSLRWTSDFSDKLPSDPSLFVYDAYAHIRSVPAGTDWYLGRQFVHTGAGSALLDGGRVHYRWRRHVAVKFFGGSSVSSADPETIQPLDDNLVLGGRLSNNTINKLPIGASWMLQRRDGGRSLHRAAIDASYLFRAIDVFGRAGFNIDHVRMAEILTRASYRPGRWYFSGEYLWREPTVASNSIFALIDFDSYQVGRVEARRRVWRQLSALAQVQMSESNSDDTWRSRLGFIAPTYSLAWVHQSGYAGDNNGVSGYLMRPVTGQLDCHVSANLFRYRVQLEQTDRSDAYSTSLGLRWRAGHGIVVHAEGQYLRNAVIEDDTRFLLRISKNFSMSSDKGGGEE